MDVKKKRPGNIKNLKPFPKGVSGNPNGRPKVPEEVRRIQRMGHAELAVLIDRYVHMNAAQLKTAWADPATTALELTLIKIVENSIKQGSLPNVDFLLNRMIGKVADNVNVDARVQTTVRDEIDSIIKARAAENGTKN